MSDLGWGVLGLLAMLVLILWAIASHKNGGGKKLLILLGLVVFAGSAFAEMRVDIPKSMKQGGVVKVFIGDKDSDEPYAVTFYDSKRHFTTFSLHLKEHVQIALIPIVVDEPAGNAEICVFSTIINSKTCDEIAIEKVDFPESKRVFSVSKPTPAIWARYQEERAFLDNLYALVTPKRYFSETLQFANPLEKMEIVPNSDFGQIRKKVLVDPKTRKIADRWKDYHKGADFRASIGTPIFSAEDGKVVAARNLLGSGNTVIVDHGQGLLSLYFHLSKIKVKEGQSVKRGDIIGLSGQSGNAQGPHLHFEIRLHQVPVNPFEFIGGVG